MELLYSMFAFLQRFVRSTRRGNLGGVYQSIYIGTSASVRTGSIFLSYAIESTAKTMK